MDKDVKPPALPVRGQDLLDLRTVMHGDIRELHDLMVQQFSENRSNILALTAAIQGGGNRINFNAVSWHCTI